VVARKHDKGGYAAMTPEELQEVLYELQEQRGRFFA
jgi:hypothetical protein